MKNYMDKIKSLQTKKLLKELDYIESDFEWRSEVVSEADSSFLLSINEFLNNNPDIKEMYDKKISDKIDEMINRNKCNDLDPKDSDTENDVSDLDPKDSDIENDLSDIDDIDDNSSKRVVISDKIKKLYREIVKMTHPDVIEDINLNDIYIKATEYYELNDKMGIYKICSELSIKYDIDEEDALFIENKIIEYKKRISFLESTFTWKWFNTEDEEERNNILITFIKMKIN
jgi:hypothetical protein